MKIATIIGVRPQFIKSAMVSRALRATGGMEEVIIHTGQHYDAGMSDGFFHELELATPAYNLGIGSGHHGEQTGRMLSAIEGVLMDERPHCALVFGDTNSTLAGALAAVKLHIPVAHVEAGLRSFNRMMPEEINRTLTDHASDLLFAPTEGAVLNLRREGIAKEKTHLVGDVMYDAHLHYLRLAEADGHAISNFDVATRSYVLATIHRAENTDDATRLEIILRGLAGLASDYPVIFPVHPRTQGVLRKIDLVRKLTARVRFIDPVGYLDMLLLEKNARLIATDSGGVQKEAYFHRVPCVTLRNETEWVELVTAGWNILAPPVHVETITAALREALERKPSAPEALYGDGASAQKIAAILAKKIAAGIKN